MNFKLETLTTVRPVELFRSQLALVPHTRKSRFWVATYNYRFRRANLDPL